MDSGHRGELFYRKRKIFLIKILIRIITVVLIGCSLCRSSMFATFMWNIIMLCHITTTHFNSNNHWSHCNIRVSNGLHQYTMFCTPNDHTVSGTYIELIYQEHTIIHTASTMKQVINRSLSITSCSLQSNSMWICDESWLHISAHHIPFVQDLLILTELVISEQSCHLQHLFTTRAKFLFITRYFK